MALYGMDVFRRKAGLLQDRNAAPAVFGWKPFIVYIVDKPYDPPHFFILLELSGEVPHHRLYGQSMLLQVLRCDVGGEECPSFCTGRLLMHGMLL
jgi:hypothetical protein